MIVVLIGIPILALVIEGAEWMLRLERLLSNLLLGTSIPIVPDRQPDSGWIDRIWRHLTSRLFWRGQAYLFAKFVFGIVTLVALTITWGIPIGLIFGSISEPNAPPAPVILAATLLGLSLMPFSARVSNLIADWWREFTIKMLSESAYDLYANDKGKRVAVPEYDDYGWDEPDPIYAVDDFEQDSKPKRQKQRKTLAELLGEAEADHISGR